MKWLCPVGFAAGCLLAYHTKDPSIGEYVVGGTFGLLGGFFIEILNGESRVHLTPEEYQKLSIEKQTQCTSYLDGYSIERCNLDD